MIVEYPVKSNVYSFLSGLPKAWQLLFDSSVVISRNDQVKVIELDNDGNPTGLFMTGQVLFLNAEVNSMLFVEKKLVYVKPD